MATTLTILPLERHPGHEDEYHKAYARELARTIVGQTFDVLGDTHTIVEIRRVRVGVDRLGLYTAVEVIDEQRGEWRLYSDGEIVDAVDRVVGRHELRERQDSLPWIAMAVTGDKPFRIVDDARDYGHYDTFEDAKEDLPRVHREVQQS